jgi:hypothetical protein
MPHRSPTAAFAALVLFIAPLGAGAASVDNPNVPTGEGDAIFAVGEGGVLEPVAVRLHGKFLNPGSNEGEPSAKLRMEANASIATGGNKVHVVFGGREIARVPAKVENGTATISIPPALHVGGNVEALASPTLTGHAKSPRRAPTAAERKAALAVAAAALDHANPAKLEVRNLTALDLGRGTAFVGTVFLSGAATTHKDRHLFFIAEPVNGKLRSTLANAQTMQSNPELTGTGEALVDAIDLGDGSLSVVTRILGYDAHTFAIYSRTKTGWKQVYEGGGVAL